ncbi:MAG: TonB-dependent receptor [Gemmatimonadota bacterium]
MRLLLAALIFLGSVAPASSQRVGGATRVQPVAGTAMVWGQVRSEQTGAPLRFAVVEMIGAGLEPISASTDISGVYVLRDVPPGRRLIRAMHIDHAPNEVQILVAADKQHVVDFDLEFRPLRLSPVTADGIRGLPGTRDTVPARDSELGPANVRVLESTPGVAELGLSESARDVPGHEPIDPADVLYVRGGAADLKLVMLNGAPVYAPFHIGGLIQALDASVLRSATLYAGGAPARYDGGLSYVMDLETRSGRSPATHAELGVDMLAARAIGEGPIGPDVSYLIAARTVHGNGTAFFMDEAFPYGYGDAVARVDIAAAPAHVFTVTGFRNHERVTLDTVGAQRESASWGNQAGSLRYRGAIGLSEVLATVSTGRFRTLLPLGGIRPLVTEGTADRSRAAFDMERPFAGGRLFVGGSFDRIEFEHRAYPQGGSRDSTVAASTADGNIAGLYVEAAYTLLPRLRVRAGMRADHFSAVSGLWFAPRVSATVLLTDRASLTLSGGRYRQYVRAPAESLVFLGAAPDSGSGPVLNLAAATHVVLGLSQDFDDGIRLGLEGFFKEFEGLQTSSTQRTAASGLDLWLRRHAGDVTGWLGYSLAWVWAVEAQSIRPAQAFSGRHLVSAGLAGPIIAGTVFDVRINYGAGLPYTAIPEPEIASPVFGVSARPSVPVLTESSDVVPLDTEPHEPYLRIDAQVSRTFDGAFGDLAFDWMPYLKVINALNRRDAIFYHYNRDVGQAQPLAHLPIVPIVGMEMKF